MTHPVPTVPTSTNGSVQQKHTHYQRSTDCPDRTDPNVKGSGSENTLADLLEHIEAATAAEPAALRPLRAGGLLPPKDIYELEAMRQHYAARAGPDLPPCTMKAGLLSGFYSHRNIAKRRGMDSNDKHRDYDHHSAAEPDDGSSA
jgi:hypothetical protein